MVAERDAALKASNDKHAAAVAAAAKTEADRVAAVKASEVAAAAVKPAQDAAAAAQAAATTAGNEKAIADKTVADKAAVAKTAADQAVADKAAADKLAAEGISACVASFHTVKPLDEAYLADAFRRFDMVCTIEEHSRLGGFGASVAEWLSDQPRQHATLCRFGTPDLFLHESGEQEHARHVCGITAEQMAEDIHRRMRGCVRLSA